MKYLVLIGDGMSDRPLPSLSGKTPLEAAKTPNLDYLAQSGICGWVNNTPRGMEPGSDVAMMSILGYDPKKYYTGRGPLEAASLGIKLKKDEIAFRCNLVTIKNGKMESFTAHHVETAKAQKIMKALNEKLGTEDIRFHAGLSYRNLLVIKNVAAKRLDRARRGLALPKIRCFPPHDITGKLIRNYLPKGEGSEILLRLMNEAEVLLHGMKTKATTIWPWGQGRSPRLAKFKLKGAVITAVHLLKGLAKTAGLEVINVPGATGYLDTNYLGKAQYALKALKHNDIVFVHVEAPDEAGHEGDVRKKIRAIEDFDKFVVGTVLKKVTSNQLPVARILVLPDHPTPIKLMTHTSDAVPFVIYEQGRQGKQGIQGYNEREIRKSRLRIKEGHRLLNSFISFKYPEPI